MRAFGHIHKARRIGAPAHAVIARTEGAADNDGEFRHFSRCNGRNELGAILGDTIGLIGLADHEAGYVLQENPGNAALAAEFDEMRALQRRFRKQNAVIGDDADGITVDMGETAHKRRAIKRLELVEFGAIHQTRDDLAHLETCAYRWARCHQSSSDG